MEVSVAGWLQNAVCLDWEDRSGADSRNLAVRHAGLTSVQMDLTDRSPERSPLPRDHPQFGNMALSVLESQASVTANWGSKTAFMADLSEDGKLDMRPGAQLPLGEKTVRGNRLQFFGCKREKSAM